MISKDSQREINRCKREMFSCGKGDSNISIGGKYRDGHSSIECASKGCGRMKQRGSDYCADHTTEMTQENK